MSSPRLSARGFAQKGGKDGKGRKGRKGGKGGMAGRVGHVGKAGRALVNQDQMCDPIWDIYIYISL